MAARKRILLIDRHAGWLQFAQEILQEQYDVLAAISLEEAVEACTVMDQSQGFDLIFVGLGSAANGLSIIKSLDSQWPFVIIFPVFQEDEKLRIFFKAGVYDCVDKPYEREILLKLVENELSTAERPKGVGRYQTEWRQLDQVAFGLERILNDAEGDDK